MLMKKPFFFFLAIFVVISLCAALHQGQASDGPAQVAGISASSEDKSIPVSGMSYEPVAPSASKSVPTRTQGKNLAPVRKSAPSAKIEILDKKEDKNKSDREKAEEKAFKEASKKTAGQEVEAMRAERIQEMPYLDRIYIRTSITPLKVQQKEEFLSGGTKDLQELILRAKSVHTQTMAAHENISLYNRRVLVAFRKLFPEASIALNDRVGSLTGGPDPLASFYTGHDWKISLRQPIFSGGILWNTFLQEKANLEAANKNYDKTIAELVFDLSRAYFEYQRTLQTAEENRAVVEKMKRFAEMSEEKFNEKLISEIEHLNVQSLYSQMQFDLEAANQELEIAKLDMQKYLDLSANDSVTIAKIYNLDDVVQGQAVSPGVPVGAKSMPDVFKGEAKAPELTKLIDLSYGHRAELQVEAAKLQAARLGERVRWGEFLPKAFLTYDVGELGDTYKPSGDPTGFTTDDPNQKKQWQLLLEVNWNIGGNKVDYSFNRDYRAPNLALYGAGAKTFTRKNEWKIGILDGLDAFVNVEQAEVDKLNQVVELEKAEKQVLQDVKQSYYDYQKAVIQVNSTVKRLEYRKRLREFAEYRLSKKEIELSEYFQAESDLVREKSELHKALKDYFSAKASLNHAVGIQDFLSVGNNAQGK